MALWQILLLVAFVGLIGGVVNAIFTEKGLVLPRRRHLRDCSRILLPGFLGNMLFGAIAAVVVTGSAGPLGELGIREVYDLNVGIVIGALVAGIGGARIVASEVDKRHGIESLRSGAHTLEALAKRMKEQSDRIEELESQIKGLKGGGDL